MLIRGKKAIILDMNGTFMFGEDRFGEDQDYSIQCSALGGTLDSEIVNTVITDTYSYLDTLYTLETFRESFPSLNEVLLQRVPAFVSEEQTQLLLETFAWHELGSIPAAFAEAVRVLSGRFKLGAVIDIWAPKRLWEEEFSRAQIKNLFGAVSFSSDIGIVKPSPIPFLDVAGRLEVSPKETLVVGDSVRRDFGGAQKAGMDCVLVGCEYDQGAAGHYPNLLEFVDAQCFGSEVV
jgi:FMN phosphatase YigB (HAD superfamily)